MRPLHVLPNRPLSAALSCAVAAALVLSATANDGAAAPTKTAAAARPEFVALAASTSMTVHWRGNGHGHGMSQYGALGAAMKKLSTSRILAFYYPRTTLVTLKPSTIRVLISDATADTTVWAGTRGLKLSGYGTLPASGYRRFRLVPSGAGLKLQGLKAAAWKTIKDGLAARADFSSSRRWVQELLSDGTSTRYRGAVGAVRNGSGELTVNRVSLDQYAQGVAPREMPASWPAPAVRAQAIAARSYAKSSMNAAGDRPYDICDTTMCQVYGGGGHFDRGGHLLYSDYPAAIAGNQNKVLTYQRTAIFAQYSASNGGATVDGGLAYLVGKNDPYDTPASGDPYLDRSDTVSVSSLARSFGLRSITSIQITKRDGNGPWGGRVVAGIVNGTTRAGGPAHVATTGFRLGDATGVDTDYLRVVAPKKASLSRPR